MNVEGWMNRQVMCCVLLPIGHSMLKLVVISLSLIKSFGLFFVSLSLHRSIQEIGEMKIKQQIEDVSLKQKAVLTTLICFIFTGPRSSALCYQLLFHFFTDIFDICINNLLEYALTKVYVLGQSMLLLLSLLIWPRFVLFFCWKTHPPPQIRSPFCQNCSIICFSYGWSHFSYYLFIYFSLTMYCSFFCYQTVSLEFFYLVWKTFNTVSFFST